MEVGRLGFKINRRVLQRYYEELKGTYNSIRILEYGTIDGRVGIIHVDNNIDKLILKTYGQRSKLISIAMYTQSGLIVSYRRVMERSAK